MKPVPFWKKLTENAGFKLVALGVTLTLWMTILGRRAVVHVRDSEVQIVVPAAYRVVRQSDRTVQVRVSGSRISLRKFLGLPSILEVEADKVQVGKRYVTIPAESIELPFGVRLVSIQPSRIQIEVTRAEGSHGD